MIEYNIDKTVTLTGDDDPGRVLTLDADMPENDKVKAMRNFHAPKWKRNLKSLFKSR